MKKNCVYVKLCGGLGNQLFQIANGYAYSLHFNKDFYVSRTWEVMKPERPSYWNSILKTSQPYLKDISEFKGTYYKEPQWNYQQIPYIEGDVIFDGYFQSEKYFEDYSFALRKYFNIYPEKDSSKTTVAIHIRRGDYLKHPEFHTILTKDYYDSAKKIIEEKLGYRPIYKYFSEDTEWIKETFKDDIIDSDIVVPPKPDIEEFQEMINCDHFILANSSFSWWASWFSDFECKEPQIVIAPKKWFGVYMEQQKQDWSSIYRKNWIQL
jgi:hypothetical protein